MRSPRASILGAASILVTAAAAHAAPPAAAPAPTQIAVEAFPIFGTGSNIASGWNEVVVRIQNNGDAPARGRVEIGSQQYGRDGRAFRATAPFSVGARASVNVRVPAEVPLYGDLVADVYGEDGASLSQVHVSSYTPAGVMLLDVSDASRLRGAVNEVPVVPLYGATGATRSSAPPLLSVGSPRFDPATGDPMLPDRAALYTSADAVVMRSDTLARLEGAELDALAGWALAGGTLAVAVVRPEDLRNPTLVAFAGGAVARQGASAVTLAVLDLPSPPAGTGSSAKTIPSATRPSNDVAETLAGYAGGNLHGSLYGSSAAYGLGEVHLLAFDPTRRPAADDPWAAARMVDLARRAFDRRSTQVFRPGAEAPTGTYDRVRRQLDPNESSRWAIAAAAILLCVYSVVAGPVNFTLAGRAGRPLRALRWLPLISAIAFAAIVAVGVAAKGMTGRSRHLTLVEAGAGMSRGSARRFRGFYASRARELTVRTTDASSLVSMAVVPDYADRGEHLVVDREGARLVDVAAMPWQTVVVREDGFAPLGDGIALVKDGEHGVAVINRSGRDLRAAILLIPGDSAYYFPRIKDGERVGSSAGKDMRALPDGASWLSDMHSGTRLGAIYVHRLHGDALKAVIAEDAPGLSEAWSAMEDAAGTMVDWFPDAVPVLVAQLDGGEGRLHDAGLRMESDRLLVRIVGYGGRP
jgi:hypothetical protein